MKDLLLKMEAERNQFYAEENARLMGAADRQNNFEAIFKNSVTGDEVETVCREHDLHYYNGFTFFTLTCLNGQFIDNFGNEKDHVFVLYVNGEEVERNFRMWRFCELTPTEYKWVY